MNNYLSGIQFFGNIDPLELIQQFGSPIYVYSEAILRQRCREIKNFMTFKHFDAHYSLKANNNVELLKIIREEGISSDAMSPGELFIAQKAGYTKDDILYVCNNVSAEEMINAVDQGLVTSLDSLAQIETLGQVRPGSRISIRFNPGIGAGHHEKVITAGKKTKFGVWHDQIGDIKALLSQYQLKLEGINMHIGSLFLEHSSYTKAAEELLKIAEEFEGLVFIDFGGGFGIPYQKHAQQGRLDLRETGKVLDQLVTQWSEKTGWKGTIVVEPGRYIAAECGVLLGTVHALKSQFDTNYAGTDLGFNVNPRPVLYDSYHELEIFGKNEKASQATEKVSVVGNICESGDIVAKDRELPVIEQGDIIAMLDSGAYCFSMCSNYNARLKPAEVLIQSDGTPRLIRRRDTLEDIMAQYRF